MALAYCRPSIVEIFHAHRQTRQKPHPPGLRSGSVRDPVHSGQAQRRFASWSTARALSNTCSTDRNRWRILSDVKLDYDRTVDQAAPTPNSLSIYLPNPESELSRLVIKGSAIVGLAQPDGRILIHYEGNQLGVPELRLFRQQAERAAMRLLFNFPHGYPTRARDVVNPRDVELVGTLDLASGQLHFSRPATELTWWIHERDLMDLGLIAPATG